MKQDVLETVLLTKKAAELSVGLPPIGAALLAKALHMACGDNSEKAAELLEVADEWFSVNIKEIASVAELVAATIGEEKS